MAGRGQEVVIDSSVAVKWFSEEEDTEKALALRRNHLEGIGPIWTSELLYYEVVNALRFKSTFDQTKLVEALQSLFALHLNIHAADPGLLRTAISISYKGSVTIYDAIPVALAQLRGTTCLTADEHTQHKKLRTHGFPIALI